MMSTTTEARHLTDAELLRALEDGAGEPRAEAHLEACAECARSLESLRADTRLITEALEAADFEEREARNEAATEAWRGARPAAATAAPRSPALRRQRSRFGPSWLKAAAILVLVAGPLAAFPGLRGWVVDRVAGPGPDDPPTATATATQPTVLRFTPEPGDFVVRFPAGSSGAITLDRSADAEAELRVEGEAETVVASSSLEIRSEQGGTYRLRLPTAVTGAWVVVGDRAVAVSDRQIDRRTVVELDG
ncbi:MAG: hypothetical protein R3314_08685 [Longimicrobiales bacterium]|nr:hypothetical protein [Longimicrobiales bacterium]